MSDDPWMTQILGDARDLALQSSRAKIQSQQQQLAAADQRIAELTAQVQSMAAQLREQQAHNGGEFERLCRDLTELAVNFGLLETQYDTMHDELAAARAAVSSLQVEYAKAAIRGRTLEARFASLLRRLLGDAGVVALHELCKAEGLLDIDLPRGPEQKLLDYLEDQ